jgi:hypothetical protein
MEKRNEITPEKDPKIFFYLDLLSYISDGLKVKKKKMKKIITVLSLVIMTTFFSWGQDFDKWKFDLYIGISKTTLGTGLNMGLAFGPFWGDVTNNFKVGDGEELPFSSSQSYYTGKYNLRGWDIGYDFFLYKKNLYAITLSPMIGSYTKREIFQDPILYLTWAYSSKHVEKELNIGIVAKFYYKDAGIYLGVGTSNIKFGFIWNYGYSFRYRG